MFLLMLAGFLLLFVQPLPSAVLQLPHEKKLTGYYQKEQNPYMLIIGRTGKVTHCHQYEDRKEAERVLAALNLEDVVKVTPQIMKDLIKFCTEEERIGIPNDDVKKLFIYPGTKWCGMGDNAVNENELGREKEADSCCRDHDHCKDSIPAFGSKYNLTNYSPFTKSNCNCDKEFHQCLLNAGTEAANVISGLYFTLLKMECFQHTNCRPPELCRKTWQWSSPSSYI
uniref:Putative Phospholipase A2 n=1 Tax=Megacormus gertschi TaxID=1843536 RepID=A0A224X3N3_9SCOR